MPGSPPKKEPSRDRSFRDWVLDAALTVTDKVLLLAVLILTAVVASQIIAYPDFILIPDKTYVNFSITNASGSSKALLEHDKENGSITIKAISQYFFHSWLKKHYNYPIFLNYSFIDENGKKIPKVPGVAIKIDPKAREIKADDKSANVIIEINAGEVSAGEYNARFWGRGGGGESLIYKEGPIQSLSVQTSGIEPAHYCTVTIVVEERYNERKLEKRQLDSVTI